MQTTITLIIIILYEPTEMSKLHMFCFLLVEIELIVWQSFHVRLFRTCAVYKLFTLESFVLQLFLQVSYVCHLK